MEMDRYERLEIAAEQIGVVLALMEAEGVGVGHLAHHLLTNAQTVIRGTAALMQADPKEQTSSTPPGE